MIEQEPRDLTVRSISVSCFVSEKGVDIFNELSGLIEDYLGQYATNSLYNT